MTLYARCGDNYPDIKHIEAIPVEVSKQALSADQRVLVPQTITQAERGPIRCFLVEEGGR